MSKDVKPGITFYRMDSGHILNKKVRLLVNEFDSDGYYIWSCLIDYAYSKNGYYFDMSDKDELELFASEYCKKKLGLVKEVIAGCIRRGLFDENVATMFGILTSDMMQHVFLHATSERRRNGSLFTMYKEYLLIVFNGEIPVNIAISHVTKANKSRDNSTDNRQYTIDLNKEVPKKNLSKSHSGEKSPVQVDEEYSAGKRIVRKQKPVEHWQNMTDTWFAFYGEKFKDISNQPAIPLFDGKEGNLLRKICLNLKKLAEHQKHEWDEKTATRYLKGFLDKAFNHDTWLQQNFELGNLVSKFNSIINSKPNQQKPQNNNVYDINEYKRKRQQAEAEAYNNGY